MIARSGTRMKNLKPSVCIDAVLEGQSLEDALQLVADSGYRAFEFWAWWEKDLDQINAARQRHGLEVSACCTRFISLTDPRLRDEYVKGLEQSIVAAKNIACSTLISQVGDLILTAPRDEQHDSIVCGLKRVAPLLESESVTLVIEPLNELVDHPGYYLIRSDEAFQIVDEVDSPNVKVVFDIYHQQISEGNLLPRITENIQKIAHFHAAGNPGRHELTRGEINYPEIFRAIEATGYKGHVGLEYWPEENPEIGLRGVARWF